VTSLILSEEIPIEKTKRKLLCLRG
jgi:hypothetical protein